MKVITSFYTARDKPERLPRYAWTYLEQLKADLMGVSGGSAASTYKDLFQKAPRDWTWADLYFLESAILRVEPADNLRRVAWRWRLRFRNIAGPMAYQMYLDSKPPDPSTANIDDLRSDLGSLAAELYYLYVLLPAREAVRDRLYLWTFVGITSALVIIALFVVLRNNAPVPVVFIVIFAGWVGGLISVQERLQRLPVGDPLFGILAISSSRWTIILAPVGGALFSIALYLLFAGGLITGALFPQIFTPPVGSPPAVMLFNKITQELATGPVSGADWAKLIIWSFIAGFAERLVPNILDRLVSQSAQVTGAASVPVTSSGPPPGSIPAPPKID